MQRRAFLAGLGGAATYPRAVRAQQSKKLPRLAFVSLAAPISKMTAEASPFYRAFFDELRTLGYEEDRSITIERWSGEGKTDQYGELARSIAASKPDVIFAVSSRFLQLLKAATSEIPIVALCADPVGFGLAQSLARPGGNITGVTSDAGLEIVGKHLEFLKQAIPGISRVAFLAPRGLLDTAPWRAFQDAVKKLAITDVPTLLDTPIDAAAYHKFFEAIVAANADAILVSDVPENSSNRALIVELGALHRVPIMYPFAEYVRAGGLLSYGYDLIEAYRRATGYVDKILKGSKPSDLPFYQPTRLYLTLNTKAANALQIQFPSALLATADEVLE